MIRAAVLFFLLAFPAQATIPTIDVSGKTSAGFNGTTLTATVALTTTAINDVAIIDIWAETPGAVSPTIVSVTSAGLTWNQLVTRSDTYNAASCSVGGDSCAGTVAIYWASAAAAQTGTVITVTFGQNAAGVLTTFGVTGAATPSSPWDAITTATGVQLAGGLGLSITYSTSALNELLLAWGGIAHNGTPDACGANTPTIGPTSTGWIKIDNMGEGDIVGGYNIFSLAQYNGTSACQAGSTVTTDLVGCSAVAGPGTMIVAGIVGSGGSCSGGGNVSRRPFLHGWPW